MWEAGLVALQNAAHPHTAQANRALTHHVRFLKDKVFTLVGMKEREEQREPWTHVGDKYRCPPISGGGPFP